MDGSDHINNNNQEGKNDNNIVNLDGEVEEDDNIIGLVGPDPNYNDHII